MIPKQLLDEHLKLVHDDRGLMRGVRLDNHHVVHAFHVVTSYGESMPGRGGYLARSVSGDSALYKYPFADGRDPVVTELPARGTQVWIVTGHRTLKTARLARYVRVLIGGNPPEGFQGVAPTWAEVRLVAAGPVPGVPTSGNSGSVCWVHLDGRWQVLGIVHHEGGCFVARPTVPPDGWPVAPCRIPEGLVFGVDDASLSYRNMPWVDPVGAEIRIPTLADNILPAGGEDIVGAQEAKGDGVPDVIIDIACPRPLEEIASIRIRGAGSDAWFWPGNGFNWSIWRHDAPDDRLILRFNRSEPVGDYGVLITYRDGWVTSFAGVRPVALRKPEVIPPMPSQQPAPSNDKLLAMQELVDELNADVKRLEDQVKLYHDENASLRDTLAKERESAETLHSSLIRVGQAMGWGR